MGLIDLIVGALEAISEFAKIISFTFRLFGNIFAGQVLLFVMAAFLIPFLVFGTLIFYGLEVFVGLIQAVVFMMLTFVFIAMATDGTRRRTCGACRGPLDAVDRIKRTDHRRNKWMQLRCGNWRRVWRSGWARLAPASALGCWRTARCRRLAATRKPPGQIQVNMILGIAFAEAIAIYALVVALLLKFVA